MEVRKAKKNMREQFKLVSESLKIVKESIQRDNAGSVEIAFNEVDRLVALTTALREDVEKFYEMRQGQMANTIQRMDR